MALCLAADAGGGDGDDDADHDGGDTAVEEMITRMTIGAQIHSGPLTWSRGWMWK